jgi:SUF system FeS cluster assembly, SufBD
MVHIGRNTRSRIVSKGISAGGSRNAYRGLVSVGSPTSKVQGQPPYVAPDVLAGPTLLCTLCSPFLPCALWRAAVFQPLTDLAATIVQVAPSAEGARNYSQCDSMLIGDGAAANTYPYIQVSWICPPHATSSTSSAAHKVTLQIGSGAVQPLLCAATVEQRTCT